MSLLGEPTPCKVSEDVLREADAVNERRSRLPGRRDGRLHSAALCPPGTPEVRHWLGYDAPKADGCPGREGGVHVA
jgi:hypothetical protein